MGFYKEKIQKAKKHHDCDWCYTKIEPGETYVYIASKTNDFGVSKFHKKCKAEFNFVLTTKDPSNEWYSIEELFMHYENEISDALKIRAGLLTP